MKNHKLVLSAVAISLLSASAYCDGFKWTGAVDRYWTNAANWTVDGSLPSRCPGVLASEVQISESGIEPASKFADKASFGTVSSAAQVVNLDGLYSISNLTVSGETAYTFGTDGSQTFPLGPNGVVEILSDTSVVPVFPGMFCVCAGGWKSDSTAKIYNRTGQFLDFNEFGKIVRPAGSSSWQKLTIQLHGKRGSAEGGFRFNGPVSGKSSWSEDIQIFDTACIVVNSNLSGSFWRFMNYAGNLRVEVTENGVFDLGSDNGVGLTLYASMTVAGKGKMVFPYRNNVTQYDQKGYVLFQDANAVCDIQVPVELRRYGTAAVGDPAGVIIKSSSKSGVLSFSGENNLGCEIVNNSPAFVRIHDPLWFKGNRLVQAGDGGLEYCAGPARFESPVSITNACTFTLRNKGTGELEFASPVDIAISGASLKLEGETFPIRYACGFPGGKPAYIAIAGKAGVVLPEGVDASSLPPMKLAGGTLKVEGDGERTLGNVAVEGGENTLIVDAGLALELGSIARTGGTVDIKVGESASVVVPSLKGTSPDWITSYGIKTSFDESGKMSAAVEGALNIAAKGDTVKTAEKVAITSSGTAGNNTLDGENVVVGELRHLIPVGSTIAIGSGETLTLGSATLGEHAASLAIGDRPGRGTLAAGSGGNIYFTNLTENSALIVNAKLSPQAVLHAAKGEVAYCGGATAADPLQAVCGKPATLRISGSEPCHIDSGNFAIGHEKKNGFSMALVEDADDVVIGSAPLKIGCYAGVSFSSKYYVPTFKVINSNLRTASLLAEDFSNSGNTDGEYAITLGRDWGVGAMEIGEGAVVSNRLIVGYCPGEDMRCDGCLKQSGGKAVILGNKANAWGSHVGGKSARGFGLYELAAGEFVSQGIFGVGGGSYGGIFLQTGGSSLFSTNTAHGSSSSSAIVAIANEGVGHMAMLGGEATFEGALKLSYGSGRSPSYASFTVDGNAEVVLGVKSVEATISSYSLEYGDGTKWNKQAYVNLNSGVLETKSIKKMCDRVDRYVAVSFDGGTLRTGDSNSEIFVGLDAINVFEGGATVDTAAKAGNKSSLPFAAPQAGRVKSVAITPFYSPVRPMVKVVGDGMGASAIARYDSQSGKVTGIDFTCAGWGYSVATAVVNTATVNFGSFECEVAQETSSGSFTKKGLGDFTLNAANTYGGPTVVEGGVLRFGVAGALPEGSKLVFKGGSAEVASGVELPESVNVSLADEDSFVHRQRLIRFLGEDGGKATTFNLVGGSGKWELYRVGEYLSVRMRKGMAVVVR